MSDRPFPSVTYRVVPDVPGLLVGDDGTIACYHVLRPRPQKRSGVVVWAGGRNVYLNLRRLVLEAFRGPCPEGMEATSDGDPRDFSAANLRWARPRGAPLDRAELAPRGSANGRARLGEPEAAEARALSRAGWTRAGIAARYGVSPSTIQAVLSGRSWAHVPDLPGAARSRPNAKKLDPAKVAEARRLRAAGGWTLAALAGRYGVTMKTICDVLAGRSWKHVGAEDFGGEESPGPNLAEGPAAGVEFPLMDPGTAAS